jgi:hypothetical protein
MRYRRRRDQTTAVAVGESDRDFATLDGSQRVEQIVDVEADLELLAVVVNLDLFLGLFLLRVVSLIVSAPAFRAKRIPRYFSLDRIAARCKACRRSSRTAFTSGADRSG